MKVIKKKVEDLNAIEKSAFNERKEFKYLPSVGLFLIGEDLWWDTVDVSKGKEFLKQMKLVEVGDERKN